MLIHHGPNKQKDRGWAGIHQVLVTEGSVIYELRLVVLDDSMRT